MRNARLGRVAIAFAVLMVAATFVVTAHTPVTAHLGNVNHLWQQHILPRLANLPPCPGTGGITRITDSGGVECGGTQVFSGFNDGPVRVSATMNTVGSLSLDQGLYFIMAKLFIGPPGTGNPQNASVRCVLSADGDSDEARGTTDSTHPYSTLALTVSHSFQSSGTADLSCGFVETNATTVKNVQHIKMTAVKVNSLQNSPF
jgi:hypothetical protein